MHRLGKKKFLGGKSGKMKTLEIRHSRVQKSGNAAFCKKKALGRLKSKNENFGNKTFQSAELRKCSVLREKSFWEAKNRKMKTLEIRHSRVQNSGNAAFCGKKSFWEAKNRKMKTFEIRYSRAQNSGNAAFCEKKASGKLKIEK